MLGEARTATNPLLVRLHLDLPYHNLIAPEVYTTFTLWSSHTLSQVPAYLIRLSLSLSLSLSRHGSTLIFLHEEPNSSSSDVNAQIEGEDTIVMQHIRSEDWVVLLDEHGLDIGSEQMADLVGDAGQTGSSALAFCIGGPYGHGKKLRERADVTIRLSSLVLNHQIALIVLLEQLYRAWTILKGQKYHH
ncbi:putative RNA methyltransferase At5g10620 isoform X4 [Magnolia sinica]|uniref:putative RNA methyltransferase At5g10620 isoform X4 n=1 Tax=Magnolia sinica TaxID=86752 RepID=UPI0026594A4F|nr:putative RNA methyltransferase At5g10620 isoform X4 [Magnolia sinica]